MLSLYVEMTDIKALDEGGLSAEDSKKYLAYSNSLTRLLIQLGFVAREDGGGRLDVLDAYLGRHDSGEAVEGHRTISATGVGAL